MSRMTHPVYLAVPERVYCFRCGHDVGLYRTDVIFNCPACGDQFSLQVQMRKKRVWWMRAGEAA